MKNKYLIIAIATSLFATALIAISNKYESDYSSGWAKSSNVMAKNLSACKNARVEINGYSYVLKNEVASQEDQKGGPASFVLRYANHAARGLIDDGPINDMACVFDLSSDEGAKSTYLSVLFGFMDDVYSTAGTVYLGKDVTVTNVSIINNKVLVSFKDSNGVVVNKVIGYDGESINFIDSGLK